MEKAAYSPMIEHYLATKRNYPDAILMYRLGDFYEMFFDDAKIVSEKLNLVLTARAAGNGKAPMCGIPHHASRSYISRLVRLGYKVAVCEQLSDPKLAKGNQLVERGITKIYTPGTMMEEEEEGNHYLCVLAFNSYKSCLLFCDLSTGELKYMYSDRSWEHLYTLLMDLPVMEVVSSRNMGSALEKKFTEQSQWIFSYQKPLALKRQDEALLPTDDALLKNALEILMGYLQKTQMRHVSHLQKMEAMWPNDSMVLDVQTKTHLELTRTLSSSARAISLWKFLDHTKTAMGTRLLRSWIEAPLLSYELISRRQDAIEVLLDQFLEREQLRECASKIHDMDRLISRISAGQSSPRELCQLNESIEAAVQLISQSENLIRYIDQPALDDCSDLRTLLNNALDPQLIYEPDEDGFVREGFNEEFDRLRNLALHSNRQLEALEEEQRQLTGIKSLKIGYNRVFGYYIDIRKGYLDQLDPSLGYQPRQTLANSTRFVIPALKDLEDQILGAKDEMEQMEKQIFASLCQAAFEKLEAIRALSKTAAQLDVLCALADCAAQYGYVRPEMSKDGKLEIHEGRHPILDQRQRDFVSNNWIMDDHSRLELITGPNMGGKSTFLRQCALIAIMAQMGSFVPASSAVLPVFDRIFTRIGANDDLAAGKSTFMVEMMEANLALSYATEHSLILFDEIGRGTSTFDGLALAQAMVEYIAQILKSRTLFSTHYHELTALEDSIDSVSTLHAEVKENKGTIEFLYRMVPGKSDKSYGIHVAKLACLPSIVTRRASELLEDLEKEDHGSSYQPNLFALDQKDPYDQKILDMIEGLDPDEMSARDALDCLYELKKYSKLSSK